MPAFRGPDGKVVYVPEDEADRYRAGGDYQEVGRAEAGAAQSRIAPTDNGVLGSVGATVSGALSGATLGGSDWLLKGILDKGQFEQLAQDRADNPILAGTAQAAGMALPALAAGGAVTPAGALGRLAAEGIEVGRATGGVLGVAQELGAAGAEGAIGNAGIYLSDVALGDRKLTAEGMNGALGTGLLFGAAGVPIAHGIEAGTIAARRMFARYAEGGAEASDAAASAWTEKAQKHLEGFDQAAELAKAKLAETQTAREAANLQRLRAGAEAADARAFTPPSEFPGGPAGAPPAGAGAATESAVPGAGAGAAPPAEPPEVTMARALRDRAKVLGGEPITPGEVPLGSPGFRRTYVIPGERPPPALNALEQLAQEPGVVTHGPVPVTADEAELGARLGEYQAARRAFDEAHAQVDPAFAAAMRKIDAGQPALDRMLAGADQSDLETMLGTMRGGAPGNPQLEGAMRRLVDTPDVVGAGGIPVGEFGAPGAGGFKSQDELARLASGTDAEAAAREVRDLTAGRAARAEEGTAVLAKGTQPRSLGQVAAEQAPVPIEQPATAVGKGPAIAEPREVAGEAGFRAMQQDLRGKLTPDEIKQSIRFSREYYTDANRSLRGERAPLDPEAAAEIIPVMDGVIAKSSIDQPLVTHRGASIRRYGDAKPGDVVYDPGFGSTSYTDHKINRFGEVHLIITSPPGTRIAAIPSSAAEGELTLARGTSLKVTDRVVHPDGKITLRATVVAQDGNSALGAAPTPKVPAGFDVHGATEAGPVFDKNPTVQNGAPTFADLDRETYRQRAYVVRPSELEGPTLRGITSGDDMVAGARTAKVRDAWGKGESVPALEIDVDPKGHYFVADGNHRLLAAATDGDRPVLARFRPVEAEVGNMDRIGDDLGRALGRGSAATPATGTLTGQLRGMQAKLGAGEDLVAMGEPAREAYRTAKAERTTAAAEHFRGEALAARGERAARHGLGDPAAPWNEGVPMAKAVGTYDAPDPSFFAKLTAPKTRDAYVAANIGRAMREEGSHAAGLARLEREWAESSGHPFEVKRLEMAHDDALERAATAADPAERAAAAQEAQVIEKQITQVGARPGAVEDIAALAPAVTRIEKAAAALTEALGDAAPAAAKEHAAAFRAAEDEASRKTVARIGQAADDAATGRAAAQSRDPLAPPAPAAEDLLLGPSQKQQRIAAAQKAQREAGAAYAKARVAEAEAQIGAKQAAGAAADARAKLGPPPDATGTAPRGRGIAGRAVHAAHVAGYAAELGSDLGIPGIPHPHDIPVIGPLLSAYLKYRALRAAAGRFMGRVPATAETRAAALAARTRDGIARSVDRSLGLLERNANTVRSTLTAGMLKATDALSQRLVDDGAPDAPAKASVSEQAAVRMREIAAVIANPALVHDAIRAQGRALTDPDLIDALSAHLLTMFQRLSDVAPKGPPPNPFTGKQWTPSPAEAIRFGQQVAIARDPQVAFQMLEAGTLTPAGAETLRACYQLLFRDGQARVIQRATDLKHPVDYSQLIRLGRLFDLPLHPSQDPEHAAVLAGAHTLAAKPAPAPNSAPTPSTAGPTTLSNLYQPSGERAQR